ncbi:protein-glutamate O-methyltransferase [Azorhizobium caulinodans ORS 571]|uniref:protein-glutamate O-methyltransferase n=1 Tax=Azorhizobium caulinodans (strain ATCC 43989 / DSM 5975 / JCM 20966 / LMG 6465 / NBRC 14845 / NCIMB 13405 / ORS 571) TaxID=438753 RepID=A8IPP5_AZOC5|nr:CheR-type MCP methyltransferase [Azorhizobium sp. AG788]BAF86663.1 protein-glutamate O-methyltransferase [Azorhizobium caulinodans ORS 571]
MISAADYEFFKKYLKQHSGLILSDDKHYLLESRLVPLLRKFEIADFGRLAAVLRDNSSSAVAEAVIEAMTTNESLFFRDKTPFEVFTSIMLPKLHAARSPSAPLRIWCAAASTGQEPYSLAMTLKENPHLVGSRRVEIFCTDLSNEVLERAASGRYNQFEVQRGLPIQMLMKYFKKVDDMWEISPQLKTMMTFRKLNLLNPFVGLGTFDIVFCRNVLIYFDAPTKTDILNRLAKVTAADGYLVLGGAETVMGLGDAYKPLPNQRGFYVPNVPAAAAPAAMASR